MNPAPPTPGPESLERARAAFLQGVGHAEAGRWSHAEAAFVEALRHAPSRPSVLLNLGISRVRLGQFAAAMDPLKLAMAADPAQAGTDSWAALATAQMQTQAWADAIDSLEAALDLLAQPAGLTTAQHPNNAAQTQAAALPLRMQLGQCQAMLGQHTRAIATLQQVLDAQPQHPDAWSQMGHLWRELDEYDKARHSYQQALQCGANAELHRYYLAALGGSPHGPAGTAPNTVPDAPRAYVESLFDQYAGDFEDHLVNQLGYQGHRLLVEGLLQGAAPHFSHALDLGCGTGLCGPLIRPHADKLTGIDVSAAMLEQAEGRKIYDALLHADIHDYLGALPPEPQFDLVLAADVFIYMGALDRVFALLATRLQPGGWFAFTVEGVEDQDKPQERGGQPPAEWQLLPSLRYAHRLSYIDRLAHTHGLVRSATVKAPLRVDQAEPLPGHFVYLRKPVK